MRRGRVDDGLALLRQSASTVETRSLAVQQVRVLALLCEAWVRAGRLDDATTAATRALSLARARGQRGDEATVLSVLARVALAASPPDRESAERRYAEALEHGVRVGMRPLVAHCHLGLGKLYRRTDKREQAHEHLTTAMTMYREMDMRFWLDKD
jgi:hypothetical protein